MPEQITQEIFEHLVALAALELNPDEAEYLRKELNHQLAAIQELSAIPLDADIPASLHGVPFPVEVRQGLRQDEWQPYPEPQTILKQAPETSDGYIVVPDIPHTTLE